MTRLLDAARAGDRLGAADLLPLVYDEVRTLAAARMAAEAPGHTLDCREHFFAAAEAMRRIPVDSARRERAERHDGDRDRVYWDYAKAWLFQQLGRPD